jgi:murein DD-endopeptidase MepM/ murein hydrolase activator NlpD
MLRLSKLIKHPRILAIIQHLGLSGPTLSEDTSPEEPEAILAQFKDATKQEENIHPAPAPPRLLPLAARLLFLALVALLLWWVWPRGESPDFTLASKTDDHSSQRAGAASLAVINPNNLPDRQGGSLAVIAQAAPVTSSQGAGLVNLAVVTPTSVAAEPGEETSLAAQGSHGGELATSGPTGESNAGNHAAAGAAIPELQAVGSVLDAENVAIPDTLLEPDDEGPLVQPAPQLGAGQGLPGPKLEQTQFQSPNGQSESFLLPTATPTPDSLWTTAGASKLPKVQIVPAVGVRVTPTPELPTPTAAPTNTPSPTPIAAGAGRLWSTFKPKTGPENDHFWIANPFDGLGANRYASPSYQFGSTAGNRYRPHHGLDISNPFGTPVKSGVTGEVIHAGLDDPELLGPYNNFYGKTVVIRLDNRLPVAGGEMDVFVLYGHMSDVRVATGQRVEPQDIVGLVGMTGIAIGPHLHVEVRLGANTYGHSVNPYLWMNPPPGTGAVAVRILTADGRTWSGGRISIARFENGQAVWARQIETYLDTEGIGPDPNWGENGAMGDVPAGYYYLIGNVNGENFRAEFTVNEGETTFVELRTQQ